MPITRRRHHHDRSRGQLALGGFLATRAPTTITTIAAPILNNGGIVGDLDLTDVINNGAILMRIGTLGNVINNGVIDVQSGTLSAVTNNGAIPMFTTELSKQPLPALHHWIDGK